MPWTVAQAAQNEKTPGRLPSGKLTPPVPQPKTKRAKKTPRKNK